MEILSFKKMMLIIMMMVLVNIVKSELHYVGGDKTSWGPKVNLTEWSTHEHFHLNDWLYFGYDRHMFNVLEVNKTSYEKCIDTGFIKNISRGAGRDVFQLTEMKTYYFLTGGGYCWQGMKVSVHVTDGVDGPASSPSPGNAAPAPSPTSDACVIQFNQILLLFIFALMWGVSSNYISY